MQQNADMEAVVSAIERLPNLTPVQRKKDIVLAKKSNSIVATTVKKTGVPEDGFGDTVDQFALRRFDSTIEKVPRSRRDWARPGFDEGCCCRAPA